MIVIRVSSFWLLVAMVLLPMRAAIDGAEVPAIPLVAPTLRMANGDFVAGELKDSDQPDILRWQGAAFTMPFDFALSGVSVIHFPLPNERPKPTGDYCFELVGGDLLYGSLVGFSSEQAEIDVPRFGLVHVQRASIRRILRWRDGADLVYLGPNGLSEWDEPATNGAWRQESGHLVTDQAGASITGNFGIPAQASIEFEVSWTAKPDFVLALGASSKKHEQAFRFEVWDGDLLILREADNDADLASLQEITIGAGRGHFVVYLDQQRDRALVFSAAGEQLADLSVSGGKSVVEPGIRLINNRGNVRLERLRIRRWDGEAPRAVQANKSRIHRSDGSIVYGEIRGFDSATKQFFVVESGEETRIDADQVGSVVLSSSVDLQPGKIRAVFQDGVRLSGTATRVEGGWVWLTSPSITEPLRLPISELHTLVVLDHERPKPSTERRNGRLEMDGVRLNGYLENGSEGPKASCLVWHPRGSATASALRRGVPGRIVYREPPPQQQTTTRAARPQPLRPQPAQQAGGLLGGLVRALAGGPSQAVPSRRSPRLGPSLYLRTGDTVPCKVERIDEKGVTFQSPQFDATFVTHDKLKAVELENRSRAIMINKPKRERLLTLPRMQKNNLPTQLIRSTSGDYLRARLIEMDAKTLTVEVRLENKELPREYVARIIWLHEDELGSSNQPTIPSTRSTATRVQALRNDGIRLTFFPYELTDATLSGKSDVLGPCRVELGEVDQLLIGGAIERAATELAYQRWRLQHAVEPKFVSGDDGQGSHKPGTESPLVGKSAPDFELDLLGGDRFRLSETKGSIVVLDFWATWCGPCVQAMPDVDRVIHEFQDRNVHLIAVNLQEAPAAITATLERLKLEMTVALDRDGVVAEKYAATAIPQTVIIDADGNVARLFIGGGPQFADQLRDALESVLTGESAEEMSQ